MTQRSIEDAKAGGHLCHIFRGEEELLDILVRFTADGAPKGKRVLVTAPGELRKSFLNSLNAAGLDAENLLGEGSLEIRSVEEELAGPGGKGPESLELNLSRELESSLSHGFSGLRIWTDMGGWAEYLGDWKELLRYEVALARFLSRGEVTRICGYDRRKHSAVQLCDVLACHPLFVVDGRIYENFYCRPASELVSRDLSEARFEHWLKTITERVRAEEEYRDSLRTASDVVASIPCGLCTYRWEPPDRLILIDCNPRVEAMTGVSLAEIEGKEFNEVWPGARESGFTEAFLEVMRTGRTYTAEAQDYRDDHLEGTYRVSAFRMPGNRLGVAFEDITELKKTRAALAAWQRDYEAIFNAVSDTILLLDAQSGAILAANEAVQHMFGYSRAEATRLGGEGLSAGTPPHDLQGALEQIALARERGPQIFEWLCRHKSGRTFWTEVNLRTAGIAGRDCVIAVVRDIDERKRLEQQLVRSQRVEALGRVAAGVAHDFNNVLAAVTGYTDLALTHLGDRSSLQKDLRAVKNISMRAGLLTKQLLTFSQRRPLEARPLNLNAVIADTEAILKAIIGKKIELKRSLTEPLDWTTADESALGQIVVSLVMNARDAMPDGGTLTLETANIDAATAPQTHRGALQDGHYVRLVVSDTGTGVDEETLSHVFEPFFTTKGMGEGTGLGLSTVYALVKQSGGEVFFESTPGKGSTCTVYLPVMPAPRRGEDVPAASPGLTVGTGTVLIVDDSETLRDLAREVLESKGYKVLTATDGQEALSVCQDADPPVDLVVTDIVMPKVDGRTLACEIRKLNPQTAVIFTSGYAGTTEDWDAEAEGTVLLEKPFTIDALLDQVSRSLDPSLSAGRRPAP
ncbi:MAG: MEDS domain-containing protein [Planctomycetota bacterium]